LDGDRKIAIAALRQRFEATIVGFMDLVEAAKHYPCVETAWVEFLGEHPSGYSSRLRPVREGAMDDAHVHGRIEELVSEEHSLWERQVGGQAAEADRERLDSSKVALDQWCDLLRQRRALHEAGLDPEAARVRDTGSSALRTAEVIT
jgi:uncharacterized protein DUF2630